MQCQKAVRRIIHRHIFVVSFDLRAERLGNVGLPTKSKIQNRKGTERKLSLPMFDVTQFVIRNSYLVLFRHFREFLFKFASDSNEIVLMTVSKSMVFSTVIASLGR